MTRNTPDDVESAKAGSRPPRRSAEQRANAAKRMRWARDRQRHGLRCYTLEIRNTEIAALVRKGFLARDQCGDRDAVVEALHVFLDETLV